MHSPRVAKTKLSSNVARAWPKQHIVFAGSEMQGASAASIQISRDFSEIAERQLALTVYGYRIASNVRSLFPCRTNRTR